MRRFCSALLAAVASPALAAEHTVLFDFDSARITPAGRAALEAAAADWRADGEASVSVVGHTDTSGSADYNQRLSERRARAAADVLASLGVPPQAMTLAWRGESEPAVATGDGVREQANRRVEISIGEPSVAPAAPETVEELVSALRFSVGPYVGFNLEDPHDSYLLGANLTVAYDVTPNISISAEQAVFYAVDTLDEGVGGRSAAGVEYNFGDMGGFDPFVGANIGYMYIDGSSTGGFFGGPEVGARFGDFEVKAAYDFVEDRDAGEGVISLTAGYVLRF